MTTIRSSRRCGPGPTMALAVLTVLTVSTAMAVVGCTDPAPTPEQLRRERVETRLRQSFTAPQSACILRRADENLLVALARDRALAADTPEADAYSQVVVDCVSDPDSSPSIPPTTEAAPSSAPGGTDTTGGTPR